MIAKLRWLNVGLRSFMEFGIVVALAIWGYHMGSSTWSRIALAVVAPLVGFGFWGMVDFHQADRWAEPLRLVQELVVSGLAAWAWYVAGQHILGLTLAGLSLVYHALVYLIGDRLLKDTPQTVGA